MRRGCLGLTLGDSALERTGQVCLVSAAVLYAISGGQKVTALNTRTWSGLEEGQVSTHTLSLTNTHVSARTGLLDAVLRTSACSIPSAVMTIWWDLMSAYCEFYQNWQGHQCILKSCLFPTTLWLCLFCSWPPSSPNLTPLWLSFSISLLNKQRQKDYADKFNKDKLKDWVRGHRSEWTRMCVWDSVW